MDCRVMQGELVAFCLGTSDDDARGRVDAHLLECTDCLRAYLRLKHHLERGAASRARPSDAARARLRDEVQATFRPTARERVRRALRRPIPLYQGLAAAAIAVLAAGLGPSIVARLAARPSPVAHAERIDTSIPTGERVPMF